MPLSDEQRQFYENNLEVIRAEVNDLKQQVEDDLQNEKKAALQMYAATCNRLGVTNDLKGEEDATVEAG